MKLPKTTEFSLKTIVENMGQIPTKIGQPQQEAMTVDMKRQLKEMALMFNEYGRAFEGEQAIMDAATAISEFMKLAETYAVNEGGDVFQENIIKKDFAETTKKVGELQKLAQECYVRKQQLGVLFDDIRHKVSRYYKIAEQVAENAENNDTSSKPSGEKKCQKCGGTVYATDSDLCGKCGRAQQKSYIKNQEYDRML